MSYAGKPAEATLGPLIPVQHLQRATEAQQQAAAWLLEHNRTGVWTKQGTLLAGGEIAPVMRSTWNWLRDLGCVTMDRETKRVTLTPDGVYLGSVKKFDPARDFANERKDDAA